MVREGAKACCSPPYEASPFSTYKLRKESFLCLLKLKKKPSLTRAMLMKPCLLGKCLLYEHRCVTAASLGTTIQAGKTEGIGRCLAVRLTRPKVLAGVWLLGWPDQMYWPVFSCLVDHLQPPKSGFNTVRLEPVWKHCFSRQAHAATLGHIFFVF